MSRDALPPVPPVIGTPATYGPETFARQWEPRRETWTEPVRSEPLVRAYAMGEDEEEFLSENARKTARRAFAAGADVLVTYALGWEMNEDGADATDAIMAFTGEMTKGSEKRAPRPAKTKVGEMPRNPVQSFRVLVRIQDDEHMHFVLAGHWKGQYWDFGIVMERGHVIRHVDWREFDKELTRALGLLPETLF